MGADTPPGMEYRSGGSITVCLSGDPASPLRGYWEKLADGGAVQVPLEKQMWGDHFGQLTDRFGNRLDGEHRPAAGLSMVPGASARRSLSG